jgi:protein tyrosine/serine phosphatase
MRADVFPIAAVACLVASHVWANEDATTTRPAHWAQPVEIDGVPNLFKVSDELYRSAQPSATGMRELKELGLETVINWRSFHSDRDEIGDTGLGYEHIYMKSWHPEEKELVRFLQIVTNKKRTPVLVHCQYGADRTGLMCAVYRVAVQGWTKDEAIDEMTQGGYGFSPIWTNLVEYVRDMDVEDIKEKTGL